MKAIAIKVRFYGLYEWGKGWVSGDIAQRWRDYFGSLNTAKDVCFWRYFECEESCGKVGYLVSTGGSIYLHPMQCDYIGSKIGSSYRFDAGKQVEIFPDIDELKEILIGAAKACGGRVEFSEVSIADIPTPKWEGCEWPK